MVVTQTEGSQRLPWDHQATGQFSLLQGILARPRYLQNHPDLLRSVSTIL